MTILTVKKTLATSLFGTFLITSLGTVNFAHANAVDEAADACIEAARLITEEDDLDGAIEEATWCLTGLTQLKGEIKLSLMPDELDGFVGSEIKSENVLGLESITRVYTRDGDSLVVTLTTTAAGGAGGALAGLGELGKLFGNLEMAGAGAAGGKKFRIQRRTAIASEENGTSRINIELKSGATLRAESDVYDTDELTEFMREFPIVELDEATTE